MKNRNFLMSDETHKRLKAYAAYQAVTIGEAIKILLDTQDIPCVRPGLGYAEWLMNLIKIGEQQGEEAAMQHLKDHPYVEADHG